MTTLKTYRAPTMAQALAEVKKDLGKEAVIVNTRSIKAGGWMGLGAKPIVEITASIPSAIAPAPRRTDTQSKPKPAAPSSPADRAKPSASPKAEPREDWFSPKPESKSETKPAQRSRSEASADDEWKPLRLDAATARLKPEASVTSTTPVTSKPSPAPALRTDLNTDKTPAALSVLSGSAIATVTRQPSPDPKPRTTSIPFPPPPPSTAQPTAVVPPAPVADLPLVEAPVASRGPAIPPPSDAMPSIVEPKPIIEPRPALEPSRSILPPPPRPPIAAAPTAAARPPIVLAALPPLPPASKPSVEDELASIKRLMGQVLQVSRSAITSRSRSGGGAQASLHLQAGGPNPVSYVYTALIESGLPPELADDIAAGIQTEIPLDQLSDPAIVRAAVLRRIARAIPIITSSIEPGRQPDGRPLTIALVGPTGVGKTTTIAKLAAFYKLRRGLNVGLITTDTYRIAAVEQLRTYARIIGLSLKVAEDAQDVAEGCAELATCDVILIDTAGRSPSDQSRLDELSRAVRAAQPHETHLVLAATSSEPVLLRTIERFRALGPDRLILTKLDESVNLGAAATIPARVALPLSYTTAGQEVPDDLEPADGDRIAERIFPAAYPHAPRGASEPAPA